MMDFPSLDELSRLLVTSSSRRVLGGAAAGGLLGLLGGLVPEDADAHNAIARCRRIRNRQRRAACLRRAKRHNARHRRTTRRPAIPAMRFSGFADLQVNFGTFRTNISVVVGPPHEREANPFQLVVQSTPLLNQVGEFSIYSSLRAYDTTWQYWRYALVPEGFFYGTLINTHHLEALEFNVIILPAAVINLPKGMALGSEIAWQIVGNQFFMEAAGQTRDGSTGFFIEAEAVRTS